MAETLSFEYGNTSLQISEAPGNVPRITVGDSYGHASAVRIENPEDLRKIVENLTSYIPADEPEKAEVKESQGT